MRKYHNCGLTLVIEVLGCGPVYRACVTYLLTHAKTLSCIKYCSIGLLNIILCTTGTRLCPVLAILQYTGVRKSQPQGPFFLLSSGAPVTKMWFTNQIRDILSLP